MRRKCLTIINCSKWSKHQFSLCVCAFLIKERRERDFEILFVQNIAVNAFIMIILWVRLGLELVTNRFQSSAQVWALQSRLLWARLHFSYVLRKSSQRMRASTMILLQHRWQKQNALSKDNATEFCWLQKIITECNMPCPNFPLCEECIWPEWNDLYQKVSTTVWMYELIHSSAVEFVYRL